MLKATLITTIAGLVTARTLPVWKSFLIIVALASCEATHIGLHGHLSATHGLADFGLLSTIGQFSYFAGALLLLL